MDLNTISKQIKNNSWDIVDEWTESVLKDKKIETSADLSKFDLIDGIPVVLLAISQNIASPMPKELSKEGLFGTNISSQAKTRLNQGYNLTEVFREYIWLREQILSFLQKKGTISKEEYLLHSRLDRALDEQLLTAVDAYTEHYTKLLRKRALTDPLTGLYNRRAFFNHLGSELRRAKRYGHPMALLMLDLDNFKQYNDKLGHLAGDKYLKSFAQFLAAQSRASDIVARFGGDEFALILSETTIEKAVYAARRIHNAFQRSPALKTDVAEIGVSIGVGSDSNLTPTEIYNQTDKLLYEAKKSGTNNIVSSADYHDKSA